MLWITEAGVLCLVGAVLTQDLPRAVAKHTLALNYFRETGNCGLESLRNAQDIRSTDVCRLVVLRFSIDV